LPTYLPTFAPCRVHAAVHPFTWFYYKRTELPHPRWSCCACLPSNTCTLPLRPYIRHHHAHTTQLPAIGFPIHCGLAFTNSFILPFCRYGSCTAHDPVCRQLDFTWIVALRAAFPEDIPRRIAYIVTTTCTDSLPGHATTHTLHIATTRGPAQVTRCWRRFVTHDYVVTTFTHRTRYHVARAFSSPVIPDSAWLFPCVITAFVAEGVPVTRRLKDGPLDYLPFTARLVSFGTVVDLLADGTAPPSPHLRPLPTVVAPLPIATFAPFHCRIAYLHLPAFVATQLPTFTH